jgi:hypothetical protein
MRFEANHSETRHFLLISVDLDVVSFSSTENVQTIFELLPRSVEHVHWNSRDRIPDTGIVPSLGTCVPADPNESEHRLVAE